MGLSSSQARLLSLTGRMHDIEYKAQKLEAQKLQMANESRHVYQEYEDALNKTRIQLKHIGTDGSTQYKDATYQALLDANYFIQFAQTNEIWSKDGKYTKGYINVTQTDLDNFNTAKSSSNPKDYFIALETGRINSSGYNAKDNCYEIYTADQLRNMNSSNNYRLMANIDLGNNWTSKTLGSGKTFDGNGYSITGLNKALFNSASSNSTIKNLNISGDSTSQALLVNSISSSGVTIENINATGTVNSTSNKVGGLVGNISGSNASIQNCSANVNVTSSNSYVGGLVGDISGNNTIIENCSSSGNVTGKTFVGGLVGNVKNAIIEHSTSTGNVIGTQMYNSSDPNTQNTFIGGFIGGMQGNSTISYCSTTGNVTSPVSVVGGFVGGMVGDGDVIEYSSASNGTVTGCTDTNYHPSSCVGGFVGAINKGTINNCNATVNVDNKWGENAGFVGANGYSSSGIVPIISNCYTNQTIFNNSDAGLDITQATSPNNNTITIIPPEIRTTEKVQDGTHSNGYSYSYIYDMIATDMYVKDTEDPNPNHKDDIDWLTNMINAGMIFLFKKDDKNDELYQVNVATDTNLQEVTNEVDLKKAEAKYEADMRRINQKDKKFDTDLAAMNNERNAIKTEMETLKSVAKENVDRTFKLFS